MRLSFGRLDSRFIAMAVASGLMMDLIDSMALATALPTMARAFDVDPVSLKLALTAYLGTVAALVPASGWLSARFGAKRVFLCAQVVFLMGSICCGLSSTLPQLIAARVLQGVGGSMMTPVGRSIVVAEAPRQDLVKAMAWFTVPAIIGPMLGPPLAGVLIEAANWRWIFFINVPVGILGILAVLVLVPKSLSGRRARFDALGFLLVSVTILCLLVVAEARDLLRPWWAYLLLGVCTATAYFFHARRKPDALLDLRLFRYATLKVGVVAGSLARLTVGGLPLLLPLALQVGMGISPLATTLVTTSQALGIISSRLVVGAILRKLNYKGSLVWLTIMTAIVGCSPALFQPGMTLWAMAAIMFGASVVRGSLMLTVTTLTFADIEPDEVGHASVLTAVTQQLAVGAGVSLAGWLLTLSSHGGPLKPQVFIMPFIVMSALGLLSLFSIARLHPEAAQQLAGRKAAS